MKLFKNIFIIITAVLLIFSLTGCRNDSTELIREAVDSINTDEKMHREMEGLYKVHAEARGDSAIVIVFKAEREDIATLEISQSVSEKGAPEFKQAVEVMKESGIKDAKVVLEFYDQSNKLIYNHVFS